MIFQFNEQLTPQNSIDIDDIGTFALEGENDEGYRYYLVAKTILGTTIYVSFGPVLPDLPKIPFGYSVKYNEMEFDENKLSKAIDKWLNDRFKMLTNAQMIDPDSALGEMLDVQKYMWGISEDTIDDN